MSSREQAVKEIAGILRGPLTDAKVARVADLERRHPGATDDAWAGEPRKVMKADQFEPDKELSKLANTVGDRWRHSDPIHAPKSIAELITLVASAGRIRVVGSGRALSDVSDPSGTRLVSLAHLGQAISNPGPLAQGVDAKRLITCGAGRTLHGVVGDLSGDQPPRALTNMGSSSFQTIAGVTATATHGSGSKLPSVHTFLASIGAVVLVDGLPEIWFVERADRPVHDPVAFPGWAASWAASQGVTIPVRLVQDDDTWRAFSVGLGCLGVVFRVSVWVRAQFWLSETRTASTWASERPALHASADAVRHFELLLNGWAEPGTTTHGCVVVRRADTTETSKAGGRPWTLDISASPLAATVGALLTEHAVRDPFDAARKLGERSVKGSVVDHHVDVSNRVLRMNLDHFSTLTGEYSVDRTVAVPAIDALLKLLRERAATAKAWLDAHPKDVEGMWRRHPVPMGPIAVRWVQGDDAYLSAQSGRDCVTIEVHFPGSGALDARLLDSRIGEGRRMRRYRAYDTGRKRLLADIEDLLCVQFDARPHWGLYQVQSGAGLLARYPGAGAWLAHFRKRNATGRFDGPLTDRLGISMSGTA